MKTWQLLAATVLVGLGIGIALAIAEFRACRWEGVPGIAQTEAEVQQSDESLSGLLPKVEIDSVVHDFGVMDSGAKGRHEFTVRNVGQGDLGLEEGNSTCKCTVGIPESARVAPGESTTIALEWAGKDFEGDFTQTATILTTDPTRMRLKLTIKGRVTRAARAVPETLHLTRVIADERTTADVRVYGYLEPPLELLGYELDDAENQDRFEVTFEPLEADQIKEEEDARSGVRVQLVVKPGLPLGAFRQKITLKTSYDQIPTLEIPVQGTVTSEISLLGKGWSETSGVLRLGNIKSEDGLIRDLFIRAGGANSEGVTYKPVEISPDLLKVELGETKTLDSGASLTQLRIEIPKGSRPANHTGTDEAEYGQIMLETSHPKVPKIRILVRFSVGS